MKKHTTPQEFRDRQARDFGRRAVVNAYRSMFVTATVAKEPIFIKLADDTPNPHGNVAPPNTPVNGVRAKK